MALHVLRAVVALLAAGSLLSCGGGGGDSNNGGSPPPPNDPDAITLTEGHGEAVALLSFGPSSDAIQTVQTLVAATRLLHQEVLVPQEFDCTIAGRMRIRAVDEDFNGGLSLGDRVIAGYQDCNQNTRGSLELTITEMSLEYDDIVALEGDVVIDLEFVDIPDGALNGGGDLTYRATADELRWTASNFRITYSDTDQVEEVTGGRVERTFDHAGAYTLTLSGNFSSVALEGNFRFATEQTFTGEEGEWPASGRLVATGRANSKLRYGPTPDPPEFLVYAVDQDGDGQYEATDLGLYWGDVAPPWLFGIDGTVIGPEPPPEPTPVDMVGRRMPLGAPGGDLLSDNARAKIYVTIPDRNELLILRAHTLEVDRRVTLGSRPTNISFSLDHEELLIALSASGEVQILDLDTFESSRIFVAPQLQVSNVGNVVETSPGILFAGGGYPTNRSLVRIDRGAGTVGALPFFGSLWGSVDLIADPAHGFLYAGSGESSGSDIYKFNTADPATPLVAEDQHATLYGTNIMSLSPDGSRLYLTTGQVVETDTLTEIGRIGFGTPWAADNGVDVVVGRDDGTVLIYSAETFQQVDSLTTDCALDSPTHHPPDVDRIAPSPVDGQWLLLGGSILCAVDLAHPRQRPGTVHAGIPTPQVPESNVPVIDLPLGGESFDAEFDVSRNRVYVSLPDTGEIVTVDTATRQVIDRDAYGNLPRGIDLSPDESILAVAFNGNGHIGYVDVATGTIEEHDLTAALFVPTGHDVAYVSDESIFVSANEPLGETYLVKTNRLDPLDTLRVTGGEFMRDRPELATSPDGLFLYAMERDEDLHKFDLSQPNAPLVLEPMFTENYFGADRVSVSPDGDLMALRGGKVVRTADFTQAGQVAEGTPLFSHDGNTLFMAGGPGQIERFRASTFIAIERYLGNCSISEPRRLLSTPQDDVLITVGGSRLCFWLLDEPTAQSRKVGAQGAYVCGTACLVRRHERTGVQLGSSVARNPLLH